MKKTFLLITILIAFSIMINAQCKIYRSEGIVLITGLNPDSIILVPGNFTYYRVGNNYKLYDNILRKQYDIETYDKIFDGDSIGFTSNSELNDYLNNLLLTGVADISTNALITINSEHHEIHEGDHFTIQSASTLNNGDSLDFIITTADASKRIHLIFTVASTASADLYIIESVASTAGDTITPINNNRNSANVSGAIFESSPTTINMAGADTLEYYYLGSGTNQKFLYGGSGNREQELILKQNTKYCFKIKSEANSNRISYQANWYEQTNRK